MSNQLLEEPGAGLPPAELFIARALFSIYRGITSKDRALSKFEREASKISGIVSSLPEDISRKQTLIKRIRGIEDSSRNWSPYMVVQHLLIVDRGILELIKALANGQGADREVRIADVKPVPEAGPEIIQQFSELCTDFVKSISAIQSWPDNPKHKHPWFGKLSAHDWLCLAAFHHGIHKRQLEAILRIDS